MVNPADSPIDTKSETTRDAPARSAPRSEREAYGRSLREVVKRVDQDRWPTEHQHHRDPIGRLRAAEAGRLPELLPIKYGRMAVSPFTFMRGAAGVMAADLASLPTTGYHVQICGDAHVRNLGAFAAPDGHIVFDVNDFDETCRAPWEWDLRRLATSLVLVGRESCDSDSVGKEAVREMVSTWRVAMQELSELPAIELARYHVKRYPPGGVVGRVLQKAERITPAQATAELTERDAGGLPRFVERRPKLVRVPEEVAARVLASLALYRDTLGPGRQQVLDAYRPYDVAFKVVGTGSIGTRDYVVLCVGNGPDDILILQVKQAVPSAYHEAGLVGDDPQVSRHHGKRVAEGQHRLQTWVDPFLGWTSIDGMDFLVRQLADHKASIEPGELKRSGLIEYARVCGETFAKAHARTGDAAVLYGYAGEAEKLDRALASMALDAANQVTADWELLTKAIADGTLHATAV